MATAAHRLNLLAALFFPLATLSAVYSAIFGMMLAHPSEGEHRWSTPGLFWGILAIGLVAGFFLARVIARKPLPVVPTSGTRGQAEAAHALKREHL